MYLKLEFGVDETAVKAPFIFLYRYPMISALFIKK